MGLRQFKVRVRMLLMAACAGALRLKKRQELSARTVR